MEEEYVYTIVDDEKKVEDDVVMVINDWYDGSNQCDYVLPVSETAFVHFRHGGNTRPGGTHCRTERQPCSRTA